MANDIRKQLAEAKAEVARLKKAARTPRAPLQGWIGGVIQTHRESNGWTLHELARRSGVAAGLMSRVESKADANPTLNNLLKIAKALDVRLSTMVALWEDEAQTMSELAKRPRKKK